MLYRWVICSNRPHYVNEIETVQFNRIKNYSFLCVDYYFRNETFPNFITEFKRYYVILSE